MNHKRINLLSYAALLAALVVAAYGFIQLYLSRRGLAPGVCSIEDNRLTMFTAMGFAAASLVLSFLSDKVRGR